MITDGSTAAPTRLLESYRLGVATKAGILAIFSLFYFSDIGLRASQKYFWFDEICTVNICRLPSFRDAQQAVLHGADYNPPLFYLLTRLTGGPFDYDLIGTRLPAIIGLWMACISLFFLIAPRFGNASGFVSMMLPLMTAAKFYAYEARPHGIVIGCAGLAALAWQRIHTSKRRALWLTVLFLSLALASLTHVYGVTLCLPLGVAELVLALRRRRIDWAVFGVMVASAIVAAPFLVDLLKTYKTIIVSSGAKFYPPRLLAIPLFYDFLLRPAIFVIALCLVPILIACIYGLHRSRTGTEDSSFLDCNVILALSFIALPVFAVGLAFLTKGPFIQRYSVAAVIGVALIAGLASASFGRHRWVPLSIAVVLACSFLLDTARLLKNRQAGWGEILMEPTASVRMGTTPGNPLDSHELLVNAEGTLPILVLLSHDYTYLFEYVPPSLQSRLWYVEVAVNDINAQLARAARDWCHLKYNVSNEHEFLSSHPRFLVYGRPEMLTEFLSKNGVVVRSMKTNWNPLYPNVLAEVAVNE